MPTTHTRPGTPRAHVHAALGRPGLSREKVLALVIRLLEITLIRVGNEEYVRDNASFGLTTLRRRHVAVSGGRLHFRFKGKSGKEHAFGIRDRRLRHDILRARICGRPRRSRCCRRRSRTCTCRCP